MAQSLIQSVDIFLCKGRQLLVKICKLTFLFCVEVDEDAGTASDRFPSHLSLVFKRSNIFFDFTISFKNAIDKWNFIYFTKFLLLSCFKCFWEILRKYSVEKKFSVSRRAERNMFRRKYLKVQRYFFPLRFQVHSIHHFLFITCHLCDRFSWLFTTTLR